MPVPCGRRSTAPQDRTARRTSGQRRKRRPTPYRRGSPDTPSPRGLTSPIGEIQLHFTADQPLRTDRKDIPYDQHPDHQLRIDRRATHRGIMRCKFAAKPGKIESNIDLPYQMIFGNRVAKIKLVEQLTLVTLQTAHHGSTSPRFASTQRNHASWPLSTDFCNKIGTFRTCRDSPT